MTSYRPPLDGIRVSELGSSVAGPAAGRLLADLGAGTEHTLALLGIGGRPSNR